MSNFAIFGSFGPVTPLPNPLGGSINIAAKPYTQRPISVDFKYKSTHMGNDAAGFDIKLTRYNPGNSTTETVGEAYFEAGTTVSNWTNMSIPIVYESSLIPDSIEFWASSSIGSFPDLTALGMPPIPFSPPAPVAGNALYLDAIHVNLPSCTGFNAAVSGTNETSVGAMDGTAMAAPSGGTAPYTYSWSNLSTSPSISTLAAGLYSVTVMDGNGCTKVGSYNVLPFSCGAFSVTVTGTNATSFTSQDGSASATVYAGGTTGPYTYQWNTGDATPSISGLRLGAYVVTVTDAGGTCFAWGYFPANGITGVEHIESSGSSADVYPNPSNGLFKVDFKAAEKTVIQVYNVIGVLVYSKETADVSNSIDLSGFEQGIYSLRTVSKNNTSVKQIVITK